MGTLFLSSPLIDDKVLRMLARIVIHEECAARWKKIKADEAPRSAHSRPYLRSEDRSHRRSGEHCTSFSPRQQHLSLLSLSPPGKAKNYHV